MPRLAVNLAPDVPTGSLEEIVDEEVERYLRWLSGRSVADSVRRMRDDLDACAQAEAQQAACGVPDELRPLVEDGVRRAIQAGRVWTNCYHAYPAHAAFGGYKGSGIGRETHKMMLEHYQQTKNILCSYSPRKLGFF